MSNSKFVLDIQVNKNITIRICLSQILSKILVSYNKKWSHVGFI